MVNDKLFKSIMETRGSYLVKDFRVFMDDLFHTGVYLTKKNQRIAPKFLYALNQKMTYPTEHVTPRNQQDVYHELHLFQHLAKTARLYERKPGKNGNFNLVPNERYRQFCALTATEQYFTLLETLWLDVDWEELIRNYRLYSFIVDQLPDIFELFEQQEPGVKVELDPEENTLGLDGAVNLLENFIAYLAYFGFWQVERYDAPDNLTQTKAEFKAASITMTKFGQQMMPILAEHRPLEEWNNLQRQYASQQVTDNFQVMMGDLLQDVLSDNLDKAELKEKLEDFAQTESVELEHGEKFIQPFKALFPNDDLQKTLSHPTIERKSGVYTFKIKLSPINVWRRVAMQDTATLDDLHRAIQEYFSFDDDHLYAFYMDGNRFSDNGYHSPVTGDEPSAEKAEVGELDLVEGEDFLYLYDFGSEWHFHIKLEKIDSQAEISTPGEVILVDGKGEAPDQDDWL